MRTRISIPALLAIGALGALAGPALAAPSETHITTPADPAFITYAVDRRCEPRRQRHVERQDGQGRHPLRRHGRACCSRRTSRRTRPAASARRSRPRRWRSSPASRASCAPFPANHVSTSSHFAGPRLLVGDVRLITNKTGAVIDYRVRAPQINGRGVYSSAGNCGVQGSATFSSGYTTSDDVFTCAARLANTIGARSALQVDGINAYPDVRRRHALLGQLGARRAAAPHRRREHRPGDGQPDDPRVAR